MSNDAPAFAWANTSLASLNASLEARVIAHCAAAQAEAAKLVGELLKVFLSVAVVRLPCGLVDELS